MSVAGNQQQTFLRLVRGLRPHWHRDPALPLRIQRLLARHKEFGARDRRLYRELIYTTLRYLPWIERWLDRNTTRATKIVAWLAADNRDTAHYRAETCGDWPIAPTLTAAADFLGEAPADLLPSWFRPECPTLYTSRELEAQLARAPLWLRLQTGDAETVGREFTLNQWLYEPSAILPQALKVLSEADVTKTKAYTNGLVEVQDLGSQLVLASVGVEPGQRWFDACAGAGGKTLQLARTLGSGGHVDAQDIRADALDELRQRVQRAGLENVSVVTAPAPGGYDGVLVDAPCTGSGTWRRAPHLKWTTTAETVGQRAALQSTILRQYATQVKNGGRLVYATCSLAKSENESVVRAFLHEHPAFTAEPPQQTFDYDVSAEGMTIMPSRNDTDGFFVASLRRHE